MRHQNGPLIERPDATKRSLGGWVQPNSPKAGVFYFKLIFRSLPTFLRAHELRRIADLKETGARVPTHTQPPEPDFTAGAPIEVK